MDTEFDVLEQAGPCPSPEHRRRPGETACQYCGAELKLEVSDTVKCPPHRFVIAFTLPTKRPRLPAVCQRCGAKKTFSTGLAKSRKALGRPGRYPDVI